MQGDQSATTQTRDSFVRRALPDETSRAGFRWLVHPDAAPAYWTVSGPEPEVVRLADDYLRLLRPRLGVRESTNREYARNLACFLTWAAANGLDLASAASELGTFATFLRSTLSTPDQTPLARPERLGQVLATVRGFYLHLVRSGASAIDALDHLHEIVELGQLGVRSYSQHGEDHQIAYYIRRREGVTYLDVGCLWPKHFSNSYFFYERGGRGLCVDANPTLAEQYRRTRPRDIFLNCGIASCKGTMTYHMHDNPVFNTFSADHAAELAVRVAAMEDSPQREGRTLVGTCEVPTMTLDEAVESSGFAAQCDGRVDFLSIDVEGLELEVLSGFDFQKLRPTLVVVEDVRRGAQSARALEEIPIVGLVRSHGYSLAGRAGINLYFLEEDR